MMIWALRSEVGEIPLRLVANSSHQSWIPSGQILWAQQGSCGLQQQCCFCWKAVDSQCAGHIRPSAVGLQPQRPETWREWSTGQGQSYVCCQQVTLADESKMFSGHPHSAWTWHR